MPPSLEADILIDRQRLKRRLLFWRVLAVLALVVAVIVALPHHRGFGAHIARYSIVGVIGDGTQQIADLKSLREDAAVKAVVLHLDTPGGAVAGGEGIHDAVATLAAAKPVVVVMDGMAASAGYMIAVAAPYLVARASTLTGSIGVILETGDIAGLLGKLGITSDPIVSGPLKGQPSFTTPLSPAGHDYLQGLVMDLYDQFVGLVAAGRHMDPARVRALADGRAYTGRQARQLGLVDAIGGEDLAVAWLDRTYKLSPGLPISDAEKPDAFFERVIKSSLSSLLLTARQSLRVDGVWALWQPSRMQ